MSKLADLLSAGPLPRLKVTAAPPGSQTGIPGTSSSTAKGKAKQVVPTMAGETAAQAARRQREMQTILNGLKKVKEDEKRGDEVSSWFSLPAKSG